MRNVLFILFLLIPNLCLAQSQYVDDSWIHGSGKVRLTVQTDNVGIGSSAPGQKLDVSGTVRAINFIGSASGLTGIPNPYSSIYQDVNGNIGINTITLQANLTIKATGTNDPFYVSSSNSTSLFKVNANGNVGIGSSAPKNLIEVREQNAFTKVYNYDGVSTYNDDTTQAKITYGSPFGILFNSSQILYVGSTSPFSGISVALSQPSTDSDALIVKYWNGSSFTNLSSFVDNTNNFQNDGTINFTAPSGWATTSVNSQTLYWISIQSTTSFTTQPMIYSIRPGVDSSLALFCSVSDTVPCFYMSQNGNLLSPNISGTQTSISTPATIVVGLPTSRQGRRVDFMCAGSKDQVCINKAIAACPSFGCKVQLLEGTFGLSASVNIQSNLTLEGMGAGSTIIKPTLSAGPILAGAGTLASPMSNFHVRDIKLDGSNQTKSGVITLKGISAPYCMNCSADHMYVYNTGATGIAFDFGGGTTITDNRVDLSGTTGTTTGNSCIGEGTGQYSSEPQVISHNILTGCGYAAILIEDQNVAGNQQGNDFNLEGNIITGSTYGIVIRGASNVTANGNTIRLSTADAIFVSDYNGENSYHLLLENNTLSDNIGFALNLSNVGDGGLMRDIEFKNNMLNNNTAGTISNNMADPTQLKRFGNEGDLISVLSGNLGIGTFTPRQSLDVQGTVQITGFKLTTSPTNNYVLTTDSNGNGTWEPSASGSSFWVAGVGNIGINTTGNVGIGSSSPTQSLDVIGTVRATNFVGNGSGLTGISGSISGLTTGFFTKATSSTTIGNSNVLTESANNIGIGSATPGQSLDVNGKVQAVGFIAGASGITLGGVNNTSWPSGSSQWTTQNTTDVSLAGGNVGIGTTITNTGAALSVMNGNVGIGTYKPNALFEVGTGNGFGVNASGNFIAIGGSTSASMTSSTFNLAANGQPITIGNNNNTSTASTIIFGSSATNGSIELRTTKGTGSGDFTKFTGGSNGATEIARFLGTGNVGIGTFIPNNAFVVKGSIAQQWGINIPTVTGCGGGTPSVKGTDNDFQITVGTTATGCTASFGGTYADASCTVTNQSMSITSALTYTVSNTSVVINQAVGISSDLLNVHCGFKN